VDGWAKKKNVCVYGHPTHPINFYTEFWPFLLFNQQQCFIYSTASFLSKLRAKKVERLRNSHKTASKQMTAYRKYRIQEPGTTISGFVDSKKKLIPTDPRFFLTVNTHIYFFWSWESILRVLFLQCMWIKGIKFFLCAKVYKSVHLVFSFPLAKSFEFKLFKFKK
jgi:hypothetical protein